jgi:hypothetical protein
MAEQLTGPSRIVLQRMTKLEKNERALIQRLRTKSSGFLKNLMRNEAKLQTIAKPDDRQYSWAGHSVGSWFIYREQGHSSPLG